MLAQTRLSFTRSLGCVFFLLLTKLPDSFWEFCLEKIVYRKTVCWNTCISLSVLMFSDSSHTSITQLSQQIRLSLLELPQQQLPPTRFRATAEQRMRRRQQRRQQQVCLWVCSAWETPPNQTCGNSNDESSSWAGVFLLPLVCSLLLSASLLLSCVLLLQCSSRRSMYAEPNCKMNFPPWS